MEREPMSKEEAIKKMNEDIDWFYNNANMEVGENWATLMQNLSLIYLQTKTDEELEELNKTCFKSFKKRMKGR